MAGRFRFRGQELLALGRGAKNSHQLALSSKKSYPAVKDYVESPDLKRLDLDMLACILIDGLGMTPQEALSLRLGDLIEYNPES